MNCNNSEIHRRGTSGMQLSDAMDQCDNGKNVSDPSLSVHTLFRIQKFISVALSSELQLKNELYLNLDKDALRLVPMKSTHVVFRSGCNYSQ